MSVLLRKGWKYLMRENIEKSGAVQVSLKLLLYIPLVSLSLFIYFFFLFCYTDKFAAESVDFPYIRASLSLPTFGLLCEAERDDERNFSRIHIGRERERESRIFSLTCDALAHSHFAAAWTSAIFFFYYIFQFDRNNNFFF